MSDARKWLKEDIAEARRRKLEGCGIDEPPTEMVFRVAYVQALLDERPAPMPDEVGEAVGRIKKADTKMLVNCSTGIRVLQRIVLNEDADTILDALTAARAEVVEQKRRVAYFVETKDLCIDRAEKAEELTEQAEAREKRLWDLKDKAETELATSARRSVEKEQEAHEARGRMEKAEADAKALRDAIRDSFHDGARDPARRAYPALIALEAAVAKGEIAPAAPCSDCQAMRRRVVYYCKDCDGLGIECESCVLRQVITDKILKETKP